MKKTLILLGAILLIIVSILIVHITTNLSAQKKIQQFNSEYEWYLNKNVKGIDVATVINKATNHNEKYEVQKDTKKRYIEDDSYSIKIIVRFLDSEKNYDMEAISGVGIEQFISNFNFLEFKCSEISYHSKTNQISKMIFTEVESTTQE